MDSNFPRCFCAFSFYHVYVTSRAAAAYLHALGRLFSSAGSLQLTGLARQVFMFIHSAAYLERTRPALCP